MCKFCNSTDYHKAECTVVLAAQLHEESCIWWTRAPEGNLDECNCPVGPARILVNKS
jgi:hypothetical protein